MSLTLKKIKNTFNLNKKYPYLIKTNNKSRRRLHYMYFIFGKNEFLGFDKDIKKELRKIEIDMYKKDSLSREKGNNLINSSKLSIELLLFLVGIAIAILGGFISNIIYDLAKKFNVIVYSIISVVVIFLFFWILYSLFNALSEISKEDYKEYIVRQLLNRVKK